MIKLVVFDIAGTTVLDKRNVAIAFMDAVKKYGLSVPEAMVNKVMGFRKIDAITSLLDKFYSSHTGNRKELKQYQPDAKINSLNELPPLLQLA